MTAIRFHPRHSPRSRRAQQLVLALVLGAMIGASMTFLFVTQSRTSPPAAGAAAIAVPGVGAPIDTRATTTAGQQYVSWYTRPTSSRAGTTTAGQQYLAWYTRTSNERRWEAASQQYASWYLRDADGQ